MKVLQSRASLIDLANKLSNYPEIGLDTESSGPLLVHLKGKHEMLNVYRSTLTGLSLAFPDGSAVYIPINHRRGNANLQAVGTLWGALSEYPGVIAIHNAKHEYLAGRKNPWGAYNTIEDSKVACTQVLSWLLQKGKGKAGYGLKALSKQHLGMRQLSFEEATRGKDFSELDPTHERTVQYACEDAIAALGLWRKFSPELKTKGLEDLFWAEEMGVVRAYRHMEDSGMGLDGEALTRTVEEFEAEVSHLVDQWDWEVPGNVKINSSKSLQYLYKEGHWDPTDIPHKKTGYSTEKEYVEWQLSRCKPGSVGYKAAEIKVRHSLLTKLVSTYGLKMLEKAQQYSDGRLHGGFNPTGTATGRPSSSYPNLLNIPTRSKEGKMVRDAFISADGWTLVSADYSQIELRVLAHLLGEGHLYDTLLAGGDPHQATADMAKVSRDVAKTYNFALIYGAGDRTIARKAKIDLAEAKKGTKQLRDSGPELFELRDKVVAAGRKRGYVKSLLGRFRVLPGINSSDSEIRGHAERAAFNYPIQGGARDIMTLGMLSFYQRMDKKRCKLVCQVYDDLVAEMDDSYVAEGKALMQECLEGAYKLRVPLLVSPAEGKRWSQHK